MALKFIIGRCGYGKTTACLQSIAKKQKEMPDNNLIFIVPEQFSLQAEKDIIKETSGKGIMKVKVLSFNRLAHTIFSEMGYPKKTPLTEVSKSMALRKILLENKDKLNYYKKATDKQGFMEQLTMIISELFRYCISLETLNSLAEKAIENKILQAKLNDLLIIYEGYTNFLNSDYISSDDALDLVYTKISTSEFIKNSEVWLDGFYGYTPQEQLIISSLLVHAKTVTITLTIDEYSLNNKNLPMTSIFFETKDTYNILCKLAKTNGVTIAEPIIFSTPKRFKVNALSILEREYTKVIPTKSLDNNSIRFYSASNRFNEVEKVALEIITLVRDKGFHYRDIAVLAGSLDSYENILSVVMSQCNIPFFMDSKKDIDYHPLIEFIKGMIEINIYNFSFDSVFSFLKTGLSSMPQDDIEILENYCLQFGIKSFKWKFEKWSFGFTNDDNSDEYLKINQLKNDFMEIISPISTLTVNKKYPINEISHKIFQVLENLSIPQILEKRSIEMAEEGNTAKAYENKQCWNIVIDIFDSLSDILNSHSITLSEYYALFTSGLSASKLSIIPPGIDNIIIGNLERTRLPRIKALFLIGVNEGIIPSTSSAEGLLSDDERDYIDKSGYPLAHNGIRSAFEEHYLIYNAITKAEEELYLTYSSGNLSGKAMLPSIIIDKIMAIFPNLMTEKDYTKDMNIFSSPAIAFHHLGQGLISENKDMWLSSLAYFENNAKWKTRTALLQSGLNPVPTSNYLSKMMVEKAFGDTLYSSVSRLEKFSSCPYSYFASYTLKAVERPIYQLNTPDLGLLFHSVLEDFSYTLQKQNLDWKNLERTQVKEFVDLAVDRQAPSLGNEILLSSNALKYLIKRLKRISLRAIWTLVCHLKSGAFLPFAYELGFGNNQTLPPIAVELSNGEKMLLTGKIDRVDILKIDGTTYVKIIDYKSGNKNFTLQDVYYGLQLQLLIYLDALIKNGNSLLGEKIAPAGIFYFRIKDPMVTADSVLSIEQIEQIITSQLTMSGLVLDNERIINSLDKTMSKSSDIIPVSYKQDGTTTASSSVANEAAYKKLCDYSISTAKTIGEEIKSGNISIKPYRHKLKSPCDYCSYLSICGFDANDTSFSYRYLKNIAEKEAMIRIKDKVEDKLAINEKDFQ